MEAIAIFIIILALQGGLSYGNDLLEGSPKVWLTGYDVFGNNWRESAPKEFSTLYSFKNKFVEKNGSDYIVKDSVGYAVFACEAPYPVEWVVRRLKDLDDSSAHWISTGFERTSNFTDRSRPEPLNLTFRTFLRIHHFSDTFFSANFSCTATTPIWNHSRKQSSIYIYMETDIALEFQGKTVSVFQPLLKAGIGGSPSPPLILPCRPGTPHISILLEENSESGWSKVPSTDFSFDPKTGFTLVAKARTKNLGLGVYRCSNANSTKTSDHSSVIVNVTSANTTAELPKDFQPHSILKGKARVEIGTNYIKCCTGLPSVPPAVSFSACYGPVKNIHCDYFKQIFLSKETMEAKKEEALKYYLDKEESDCARFSSRSYRSLLECTGENIDYFGEILKVFRPQAWNISWRRQEWKKLLFNGGDSLISLTQYKDVGRNRQVKMEEKGLLLVGYNVGYDVAPKGSKGYIFPSATKLDMSYSRVGGDYGGEENIVEYGRNVYYEGERLRFLCFGLQTFYSFGSYIRLNFRNGTNSVLNTSLRNGSENLKIFHFYGSVQENFLSYVVANVPGDLEATLEMDSVDCFLPPVNSSSWDKLKYSLHVHPSVAPRFAGKEEETVYFGLNEKEMEIHWEIVEGAPRATVNCTKDGVAINDEISFLTQHENGTGSKMKIKFRRITSGMQGMYQCIAMNFKGTATKYILVVVTGRKSHAVMITGIAVSLIAFAAIFVAVGVCRLRSRKVAGRSQNNYSYATTYMYVGNLMVP